jgi:hypothetical protein
MSRTFLYNGLHTKEQFWDALSEKSLAYLYNGLQTKKTVMTSTDPKNKYIDLLQSSYAFGNIKAEEGGI